MKGTQTLEPNPGSSPGSPTYARSDRGERLASLRLIPVMCKMRPVTTVIVEN